MIERIRTEGFKGFTINESVPNKVIYSGKNKSGKSTRAGAIAIALYGYIPFSTAGKRPGDILDSFGSDSLVAAVTIGGKEFGRKFTRNSKGGVSQAVQIDKKRVAAENYTIMLDRAGAPRIADYAEFMRQSDTKKVDTLFELYPNPELSSIDSEIEEAKAEVSKLEKKKSGAESTIQRLTNSKHEIEIPAGSIAETQAEIKKITEQISDIEKQIKDAEIEEAKAEAKEEGKKEAVEEKKLNDDPEFHNSTDAQAYSKPDVVYSGLSPITYATADMATNNHVDITETQSNPTESIQRIINALTDAGCGTCAALIIAKQELKKYE